VDTIRSAAEFSRGMPGQQVSNDPWEYYELGKGRGHTGGPELDPIGGSRTAPGGGADERPLARGKGGGIESIEAILDAEQSPRPAAPTPVTSPPTAASPPDTSPMSPSIVRRFQQQVDRLQREKDKLIADFEQRISPQRDIDAWSRKPEDALPMAKLTPKEEKLYLDKVRHLEERQEDLRGRMRGEAQVKVDPTDFTRLQKSIERLQQQRQLLDPRVTPDFASRMAENTQDIKEVVKRMQAHPHAANMDLADYTFYLRKETPKGSYSAAQHRTARVMEDAQQPTGPPLPADAGKAAARMSPADLKKANTCTRVYGKQPKLF
jgi:hypothetical protein